MADIRQQNETYQNAMIACYADYGLKGTKNMAGGVFFMDLPQDPATNTLVDKASADCNARVPLPEHFENHNLDDAAYARMLDTRECIIAHGFEVPEPPSAETWKDSNPWDSAWNPYDTLAGGVNSLAQDKLFALADACPQPGPNYQILAPTGDS